MKLTETEKKSMRNKEYYAEHREEERRRVEAYKAAHREEVKAKNKEYREKNADRIKAYRDTPEMKEYQREYQKNYRARKKAEAEARTQERGAIDLKNTDNNMKPLSAWLEMKALIDSQFHAQDFLSKNLEDMISELADIRLMYAVSNSSFLWNRANNYFSCKQREAVREAFCESSGD